MDAKKPWNLRERQLARLLAIGESETAAAKQVHYSVERVRGLLRDTGFVAFVQETLERMDEHAEEELQKTLEDAEKVATLGMMNLAETAKDEKVRFQAYESILNRRGQRGTPAQRIDQRLATLNLNVPLAEKARSALADPGIPQHLKDGYLKLLPAGEDDGRKT